MRTKPKPFGVRLRELRADAGLTLAQLAARAGCTKDYVWRLESGRQEPSWDTAKKLATALNVGVGAFS